MIKKLIEKFDLMSHPEGGWYQETYKSDEEITRNDDINTRRSASTAILFLVGSGNVSRLHRIASDEIWHFYLGSPLTVVEIGHEYPGGFKETVLGQDIMSTQVVQYTVKKGTWFGCYPQTSTDGTTEEEIYSFVGCTVAPGFEFADFELASRAALLAEFAASESSPAKSLIVKLTEGLP